LLYRAISFNRKRVKSYTGESDYYFFEFGVPDIFELNEDEVDELMKYAIIFVEKDKLNKEEKTAKALNTF